jgi:TRAP-type mannitol/chloroaromatic compound transport system permease small subunit
MAVDSANQGRDRSPLERVLSKIDWFNENTGKLFSFLILIATVQICFELTLRYVFNRPTIWGIEMSIYLCAATYVIGGAYAHRFDSHIRVDVFYMHLSPRMRTLFDFLITDLLFFFFCSVLVIQSGSWAWDSITKGLTSGTIWDPPIWPMRSVLFLGSLMLLMQGVAKFLRDLMSLLFQSRRG